MGAAGILALGSRLRQGGSAAICVEACWGGGPGARSPASPPWPCTSWWLELDPVRIGLWESHAAVFHWSGGRGGGVLGGDSCIWLGSAWAARRGSARLGLSPRGAGDGVGARRALRSDVVGATAVQRAVVGARRCLTVVAPICWSGGSRPRGGRPIFQLHEQR
jgi:hypothetical protein